MVLDYFTNVWKISHRLDMDDEMSECDQFAVKLTRNLMLLEVYA